MEALIGIADIVTAAAITPGPNNFVVMRTAARSGFAGALAAVIGVVLGCLALLGIAATGGAMFVAEPRLRVAVALRGLYLAWLGARLVWRSFGGNTADERGGAFPTGVAGLFFFQFLNPKSWAMVLTATSAVHTGAGTFADFAHLSLLFVVIPTVCLSVWSLFGTVMSQYLFRPIVRPWFDRAMGCLLAGSAVLLLVGSCLRATVCPGGTRSQEGF